MSKSPTEATSSSGLGDRLLAFMHIGSGHRTGSRKRGAVLELWSALGRPGLFSLSLVAVLSAVAGTLVLYLLNAEAREAEYHGYSRLIAFAFLALLVVYRWAQSHFVREAATAIEAALHTRRVNAAADVLDLSLEDVDAVGLRKVVDGVSAQYAALSQTLVPIIAGAEGLILLLFMFGYLVYLSPLAAMLTTVVVVLTVIGFVASRQMLDDDLRGAAAAEDQYREIAEGLVRGAKELSLNRARRDDFEADMQRRSEDLAQGRSSAAAHFASMLATGNSASYLMAGAVVFVLPLLSSEAANDVQRIMIAVIFLLGPISAVVQTFQQLTTAQFALSEIDGFQTRVRAMAHRPQESDGKSPAVDFQRLELRDVSYQHGGEQGFEISEIALTLTRGEIVFMTGGNGSGKTTLLRVLTGLYPRRSGDVLLNDTVVDRAPPQKYRSIFSTVFADFHVFSEPYGLDAPGLERFERWLVELNIRDKLGPDLRAIDTTALSTGQRKRLSLALALAEDRPVLILDEWAADQDPETRHRFYTELLPAFRDAGKVVLAATHDEQFFHCCDRRVHMAAGKLKTLETHAQV